MVQFSLGHGSFHDYEPIRIVDNPEIEVQFIESGSPPSGGGETGGPLTAPAVANAVRVLTGTASNHLPFPERDACYRKERNCAWRWHDALPLLLAASGANTDCSVSSVSRPYAPRSPLTWVSQSVQVRRFCAELVSSAARASSGVRAIYSPIDCAATCTRALTSV